MTPAMRRYRHAEARLRVARARLLLQISGPDRSPALGDLLTFAGQIGGCAAADTVAAFRAAQEEALQAAQAELAGLTE